jgi:hypothetical protein
VSHEKEIIDNVKKTKTICLNCKPSSEATGSEKSCSGFQLVSEEVLILIRSESNEEWDDTQTFVKPNQSRQWKKNISKEYELLSEGMMMP